MNDRTAQTIDEMSDEDIERMIVRNRQPERDNARLRAALADFVDYVSPGDDTSLAAMLDEARALIAPECSVCRRRHGQEVQHPCE